MDIEINEVQEIIKNLERSGELSIKEEKYLNVAKLCVQLAAENVALNNFIAKSCYVQAGENASWYPAIDHAPKIPTTNQLSIEESQFLTDAITAAGLLSCGKQDKWLARRITDFCVVKRGSSNPAQLREGADK